MKWHYSHYFLPLFTNTTNYIVSSWMQVSLLFGPSASIYRENLQFTRKNLEIWLVNACHVKAKGNCKADTFEQTILVWAYSLVQKTKGDKYSSCCYLFLALLGQVVYFHETDYYCTILSHYLKLLAKVLQNRCLQNFAQFAGKYLCRSLFLNSQQSATFLIRGSDLDVFLGILGNVKNIIFAEHLETSASVFMEHFWNIT